MSGLILRRAKIPNLGDSMNDNLLQYITGRMLPVINHRGKSDGPILIAIGSILQWADANTIVWGSGFISANSAIRVQPKKICAVRGPLSRNRLLQLGFECPEVYGDPALLYPKFFRPNVAKTHKLGIVAHYIDRHSPLFAKLIQTGKVLDINVKGRVNDTVQKILSCERIISSSLHGLIIADAYGIPSAWIKITDGVIGLGFKFRDYFASVGRTDVEPLIITEHTTLKDIYHKFQPYEIKIDLDRLMLCCPVKR